MSSFLEGERTRAIEAREQLFRDPGQGLFRDKEREFVLSEPVLNLWAGIREDALAYFHRHGVSWWQGGSANNPTGHLLSSQIACVNHLYFLRQREDVALAVLQGVDPDVVSLDRIDDGFVAFEFIGEKQYLNERGFTRGANCTSLDAAMVGITATGERRLFLIEWKYVESYQREDKYIPQRAAVYDHHIVADDSPFKLIDPAALYFEPFYQLMRQTLLGSLMAKHGELGCRSFRHVHVAPARNHALHTRVTAPALTGDTVYDAWRGVLREPAAFITRTPEELLRPALSRPDTKSVLEYLGARYWRGADSEEAAA